MAPRGRLSCDHVMEAIMGKRKADRDEARCVKGAALARGYSPFSMRPSLAR